MEYCMTSKSNTRTHENGHGSGLAHSRLAAGHLVQQLAVVRGRGPTVLQLRHLKIDSYTHGRHIMTFDRHTADTE